MFYKIISAFAALGLALPAAAQDLDLSPFVRDAGLSAAHQSVTNLPEGPARSFALGGLGFLAAIEHTLQIRYRQNADFGQLGLPVLRLPLPPNPTPEPIRADLIRTIFQRIVDDMTAARQPLSDAVGDFGVIVDLNAVWFDINENAQRDSGEDLLAVAAATLDLRLGSDMPATLEIRFDAADAAWLAAYTHLLEGFGHLVLAFDPTDVMADVAQSTLRMQALQGGKAPERFGYLYGNETFVDMFALVYGALNQQPDVEHTRAARSAWLQMITQNQQFWTLVAQETDDDREWVPTRGQTSALGIPLPDDAAAQWQAVLGDAKNVLNGTLLVEHWRVAPDAGINVARLLDDPIPVDIVTWVQGHGLINYMERGPLVSSERLRQFDRLVAGDSILFMLWLN